MAEALQLDFSGGRDQVAELIAAALAGQPWPLEMWQRRLLCLIAQHRGAAQAISIEALRGYITEMSERQIKATVKTLVEDFHIPIGSSRVEPAGYFIVLDGDDLAAALRPLQGELRSIGRRVRILGGKQKWRELLGQMQLGDEDEGEKGGAA